MRAVARLTCLAALLGRTAGHVVPACFRLRRAGIAPPTASFGPSAEIFQFVLSRNIDKHSPFRRSLVLHDAEAPVTPSPGLPKTTVDSADLRRTVINLAFPALLALSIDPLMSVIDTVFVSRWAGSDPLPLAAMGSATPALTFAFYIFNFLSTATAPMVSSCRARGEMQQSERIGGQALTFAAVIGVTLTAVLWLEAPDVLASMGSGVTGASEQGINFLRVRAAAAPAVLLVSTSIGILRGCQDTTTSLLVLIAANLINIALDLVLIFGFSMGASGAALATTSAEWFAAVSFLWLLRGSSSAKANREDENTKPALASLPVPLRAQQENGEVGDGDLRKQKQKVGKGDIEGEGQYQLAKSFFHMTKSPLADSPVNIRMLGSIPPLKEVQRLVAASSAVFLRTVVLQACLTGAAAYVARSGAGGAGVGDHGIEGATAASLLVAAHQIALQLWLLCSFVSDSLAAAAQTLVADALGAGKDPRTARAIATEVLWMSAALGLLLFAGLFLGLVLPPHLVPLALTSDPQVVACLVPVLSVVITSQPLNAVVFALDGVLQGCEDFGFQSKSMLLSAALAVAVLVGLELESPLSVSSLSPSLRTTTSNNSNSASTTTVTSNGNMRDSNGMIHVGKRSSESSESSAEDSFSAGLQRTMAWPARFLTVTSVGGDCTPASKSEGESGGVSAEATPHREVVGRGAILCVDGANRNIYSSSSHSLVNVWLALTVLQTARGATALFRISQPASPLQQQRQQ